MAVQTEVKISAISYVILYVKDTEKATAFYRDKLGMNVKFSEPSWVELESGATTLALHKEEKPAEQRSGQAIVVFGVDDIYRTYEALKERGVKFEREPQTVCESGDHIGKSADFKDPDGNPLSIFGMVPAEK